MFKLPPFCFSLEMGVCVFKPILAHRNHATVRSIGCGITDCILHRSQESSLQLSQDENLGVQKHAQCSTLFAPLARCLFSQSGLTPKPCTIQPGGPSMTYAVWTDHFSPTQRGHLFPGFPTTLGQMIPHWVAHCFTCLASTCCATHTMDVPWEVSKTQYQVSAL